MECKRCLLTTDIPDVKIGKSGQCNFCDLHDEIEKSVKDIDLRQVVKEIKRRGRGRKYDCLIGVSGGFDSSYMMVLAKTYGLRTLIVHFDNGWNSNEAEQNMQRMIYVLGFDFMRVSINMQELNKLNKAFLLANVPDADIPNDMAMSAIAYDIADKYGIKTILNGHNYRYEGSSPLCWSYMDAKYIESVAKWAGIDISFLPLLTLFKQLKYSMKGIKQVRLLYYIKHDKKMLKKQLEKEFGWKDYGGNHGENVYTEFVGNYLLPKKFGIDKQIIYRSAEVRSKIHTKDEALRMVKQPSISSGKLEIIKDTVQVDIKTIMQTPGSLNRPFKRYDFKKWRIVFWLLTKMGFFPLTFYKKYCL